MSLYYKKCVTYIWKGDEGIVIDFSYIFIYSSFKNTQPTISYLVLLIR